MYGKMDSEDSQPSSKISGYQYTVTNDNIILGFVSIIA